MWILLENKQSAVTHTAFFFLTAISIYCSHHTNLYKTEGFAATGSKENVFLPQSCRSEGDWCFLFTRQSTAERAVVLWFKVTTDSTGRVKRWFLTGWTRGEHTVTWRESGSSRWLFSLCVFCTKAAAPARQPTTESDSGEELQRRWRTNEKVALQSYRLNWKS